MHTNTTSTTESAVLVGVLTPESTAWELEDSLNELELLADTAGAHVTDRVVQSLAHVNPATYVGKGKVEELKGIVGMRESDLVIFDDDLSPLQARNLEKTLGCKILDRTALILDIFAARAKSATAKTQVELAQLEYLRTRLTRQWTHLSRQKGGIGTKGPGETQIETDRRLIGNRISTLQERLERIDRQRASQRKGRSRFTRVSLVGYTNAGKSTLMNTLANAGVLAENRLFATLDATTRTVDLSPHRQVLLSDTVGFIRKLPHRLIESFKSTLDEVRESDILLHVVDATHPRFDDHISVVRETLKELGALEKPTLLVFNKADAIQEHGLFGSLRAEYPDGVFVSALRGIGIEELKQRLATLIEEDYIEDVVCIPVTEARLIARIHSTAEVISQEYLYAQPDAGGNGLPVQAVARLHFRIERREAEDLAPLLEAFAGLRPLPTHASYTSAHPIA